MIQGAKASAAIDLHWIPLGAGGHFVRLNGKIFEAIVARRERRRPADLYHAALMVQVPEGPVAIECAWVTSAGAETRGVVATGPVFSRVASRLPIFRYEVRCWPNGTIPDLAESVDSPQRLSDNEDDARRLIAHVPRVPTPTWGLDELKAGDMWNSNSVIAWLIAITGLDEGLARLPSGGRAPGWDSGLAVASRGESAPAQ